MCPVASLTAHKNGICFGFFSPLQRCTNRLVAPRLHLSVGTQSVKQNKRYCRLMFQSHFPPVSLLILFFFACFLISPQTTFTFAALPHPPPSLSPSSSSPCPLHLSLLSHLFCISNLGCFKFNARVCVCAAVA